MENCTHIFPAKNLAMVESVAPEVVTRLGIVAGCDNLTYGFRYIYPLLPPKHVVFGRGGYNYTAADKWIAAQINECS
jgi:hypothetical protein